MTSNINNYDKLTACFPLRTIKCEEDNEGALALIDQLMNRELNEDESDYLNVLGLLVEQFEEANYPLNISTADIINHLLKARNMKQEVLLTIFTQKDLLAVMTDDINNVTIGQLYKLAELFKVEPTTFFPIK